MRADFTQPRSIYIKTLSEWNHSRNQLLQTPKKKVLECKAEQQWRKN